MRARRAHPVISEIIEVAEDRKDRLLRMALLDDALTAIRPHMDPTTLRPRLRSDDEYEKVEFELLTAAAYARHGCILKPNFGTPGPDFAVSIGASGPAWIEC
jgi:hypothetical protein